MVAQIDALPAAAFTTIALDRPGRYRRPKVAEMPEVAISGYPGTVRQFVVTGLGRDAPTVIITNNRRTKAKTVIETHAHRMCIDNVWPRLSAGSTSTPWPARSI